MTASSESSSNSWIHYSPSEHTNYSFSDKSASNKTRIFINTTVKSSNLPNFTVWSEKNLHRDADVTLNPHTQAHAGCLMFFASYMKLPTYLIFTTFYWLQQPHVGLLQQPMMTNKEQEISSDHSDTCPTRAALSTKYSTRLLWLSLNLHGQKLVICTPLRHNHLLICE